MMQGLVVSYAGSAVSLDTEPSSEVAREFEQRLADCSSLAMVPGTRCRYAWGETAEIADSFGR